LGEKVFESNNKILQWDKVYKGVSQLHSIFVYQTTITFLDEKEKEFNGSITLIR